ncbi:MAG: hypothetical protein FWE47_02510 [Oscillospiraceae bacterium]|nr:hypothetical protein [Oscillospiraceae bacterium]
MKKFFTKVAPAALAVVAMGVPTLAAGIGFTMPKVLISVIGMMMTAFQFIGVATVIFGAIQMGFAFKNDDADGKTKGMRAALSGAIVYAVGLGGSVYFTTSGITNI